jgi:DNA-binding NarL/FixJ family response regulator
MPLVDAGLVELLAARGIDAEAVALDGLGRAAATSEAAACVIPLAADVATLGRIRRAAPRCRILVLGDATAEEVTPVDERRILEVLQAGADGVAFAAEPADVVAPLLALLRGESVLPRRIETLLVDSVIRRRGRLTRRHVALGLTSAEAAVCELLVQGRTTSEIASALGLSAVTVRRHISRAATKVGARGRAALIEILGTT